MTVQIHTRTNHRQKRALSEKIKKALALALAFDGLVAVFLQPYRPVLVVGESMLPTLQNHQLVLAKRLDGEPVRGQVVVCDYDEENLIKRVAGVAGDRELPGLGRNMRVPWHHVYLLGDNSKKSVDSRVFGPVPDDSVKYTVVFPFVQRS